MSASLNGYSMMQSGSIDRLPDNSSEAMLRQAQQGPGDAAAKVRRVV